MRVARNVQQPRFRFFWNAMHRASQRLDERVAERVFRTGDITRARREKGDQSAILVAPSGFICSMRRGLLMDYSRDEVMLIIKSIAPHTLFRNNS